MTGHGGTRQGFGGRSRWISLSLRPGWFVQQVSSQPELYEALSYKKKCWKWINMTLETIDCWVNRWQTWWMFSLFLQSLSVFLCRRLALAPLHYQDPSTLASIDFNQRKAAAGERSWLKVRWESRFLRFSHCCVIMDWLSPSTKSHRISQLLWQLQLFPSAPGHAFPRLLQAWG